MRITPLDVRKQEFDRALRGLDPDEVHAFLATVADEYEAVLTDNKQLRDKVIELDQKVAEYRNMERTLRDTLLTAERVMTDARQNARKEAENILREAEVKAREATSSIQNQVDSLRAQMRELRGQRDGFLARLQSLAEAQMGLTESYRKDFRDDDDRTERLMHDPGAILAPPVAKVVDEVVDAPVITPTPTPDVTATGTSAEGPTGEPTAPPVTDSTTEAPARGREDDHWRGYDLGVGDTAKPPAAEPVDTGLPVHPTPATDPPSVDAAPDVASAAGESASVGETPKAETTETPTAETAGPADPAETDAPSDRVFDRAVDEVAGAVDSALEPSGPVMPITADSSTKAPGEDPGLSPALEAAEAAGQNPETLATPDVPDPTGEQPVESAETEAGRWSLSRFTKGLGSF